MNLYVFMSRSFRKRLALKKLKMWVFFLTRLGQVLYNVGSFSRGGNIMKNKLQAKGLGLNGEVLFDEELDRLCQTDNIMRKKN